MPVFNKMVYNGTEYILGGGGNIGEPLNLTVTTSGLDATITWEDNEIGTIPPTTFQKSELVRKIGSAPTSPSDGDLVVTETVKDTYKTTGYVDQGLTDGETYYYRVFSYSDLGGISYCDAVSVTPSGLTLYTITGSTTVGSYTPSSFSDIQGCYISPDGTKMYICFWNNFNGKLAQYDLSTPWDVTTATQVRSINVTKPDAIYFSDDGLHFFISNESDHTIKRYTLTTAWDISTATQDQSFALSTGWAFDITFENDGKYMVYGRLTSQHEIRQCDLTTPYDLTTITNEKYIYYGNSYSAGTVRNEGKYFYIANPSEYVIQYELATPYDITSNKTEIGRFTMTGSNDDRALYVSPDGKYWTFGTGNSGVSITQYQAQPIS